MTPNSIRNAAVLTVIAASALFTSCTNDPETSATPPGQASTTVTVQRVIDGDTLVTDDGARVRLVGIDTPERGQPCAAEATRNLKRLTDNARITLSPATKRTTDRYGRTLAYVDTHTVDAGLEQIKAGLAVARYDSRDGYGRHPRETAYIAAGKAATPAVCATPRNVARQPSP